MRLFSVPWASVLLLSLVSGPLYRQGSFPVPSVPDQVVPVDYGNDGDPDLLLVSSLPGGTRLLENEGAGTFVDITETTDLPEIPGFLALVPLPLPSPWLVGTDILSPQRFHLYRLTPHGLEEWASVDLPAGLSGSPLVRDSLRVLLPLETGVLTVEVDTLGGLEVGPFRGMPGPVWELHVLASDTGQELWLVHVPRGWFLGPKDHPQAPLPHQVCPLPLTDAARGLLVAWDTTGTTWLLDAEGGVVAQGVGAPKGTFRFLPVWSEGLWGWGTTAAGQPALVRFRPSVLQWELLRLDSLGEVVYPIAAPESPAPVFVVFGHDSAVVLGFSPVAPLRGWRSPPGGALSLWFRSRYVGVWYRRWIPSALPFVAVADVDSALWFTPSGPVPLRLPGFGSLAPLEPAPETQEPEPTGLWVWPNPTHRNLRIEYLVTEPALVEVLLCRTDGQVLQVLDRTVRDPGRYEITAQLEHLPPGQYLVVCRRGNEVENQKIILIP